MGYSQSEINTIKEEDFTTYFMCSLGTRPDVIDVLTIVNKNISFDEAEKNLVVHNISPEIDLKLVPYEFLKDIKLRSTRNKDLYDIARLEELRSKK